MFDIPVHVLDFEGSRRSGILEAGIVTLYQGKIRDTFTALYAPIGFIQAEEIACHGLSEGVLSGYTPFVADFARYRAYRETGLWAAHHASVEESLMRATWPHPGEVPFHYAQGEKTHAWGPWVDTLALYHRLYPGLASYRLMELVRLFVLEAPLTALAAQHCPVSRRRPHAALFDALAAALLLLRLLEEPGFSGLTLTWLLEHSQSSAHAQQALRQTRFELV